MAKKKNTNIPGCTISVQTDSSYTKVRDFMIKADTNYIGVCFSYEDITPSIIKNIDIYASLLFSSFGAVANGLPKCFESVKFNVHYPNNVDIFKGEIIKNEHVYWNGNVSFDDVVIYYTRGNGEITEEWFCLKEKADKIDISTVRTVDSLIEMASSEDFNIRVGNIIAIFNPALRNFGLELFFKYSDDGAELKVRGVEKPKNTGYDESEYDDFFEPLDYEVGEVYDLCELPGNIYTILKIAIDIAKRKSHFPCVIIDLRTQYNIVSHLLTPLHQFLGDSSMLFVMGYNKECGCTSTISLPMIE